MTPRLAIKAIFILFLTLPAVSPASACRGDWFDEQESAPLVRDVPFPDVIESLPRRTMRIPTSTCGPSKHRFSILYGDKNVEWAEIIISDRLEIADRSGNLTAAPRENPQVLSEIGQKLAKIKSNSQETVTLLSTEIDGFAGLAFLTRKDAGAEFKTFFLPLSIPLKSISIEYNTYDFNDAESRALNFRNTYINRIMSFIAKEGTPASTR
ncbi:hypothetical protein [Microvirga zambiensis]|uniref:hypothetical protein n=1 Tax=Microvirga zambiensis TaxID=1402137 RepID=UPI00191FF5A9|nr:hypothetical protein [Microvirga zambiensis]